MAHDFISASAPGSLMLFGEHAVLRGFPAIACAVNSRLRVVLEPRGDRLVQVTSDLGRLGTSLDSLEIRKPFTFLLTALQHAARPLEHGFDIRVEAEFSSTVGLGSSAAVTVATLAALDRLQDHDAPAGDLLARAIRVIRAVQGLGSGTDAAASLHGGVVLFDPAPQTVTTLPGKPPISLVYSGAKDPTANVVARVNAWEQRHPVVARAVFEAIAAVTHEAAEAFREGDLPRVGALMNTHQGLQDALGVSHRPFAEIIAALRENPAVLGCKISGSGLGDCAVALGDENAGAPGYQRIPVRITGKGVAVEAR